jgi:uncharacterized protein YdaU (DUF1376 family)
MLEHGAYNLLLDAYYEAAGPLPSDRRVLYRICRATTRGERRAVDAVLAGYFIEQEAVYRHARADQEIAHVRARRAKARENGALGGRRITGKPKTKAKENRDRKETVSEKVKSNENPEHNPARNQSSELQKHQSPGLGVYEVQSETSKAPTEQAPRVLSHEEQRQRVRRLREQAEGYLSGGGGRIDPLGDEQPRPCA